MDWTKTEEMVLKHKDGTTQKVKYLYGPFSEEGGFNGEPVTKYDTPMAVVELIGVDIKNPWSIKTVPIKYLAWN